MFKSITPKIELHCHLDGSLRPETVYNWLKEMGEVEAYSSLEALSEALIAPQTCDSLDTYLKRFDLPLKTLQTEAHLRRAAFEIMEDAAAEGVKYMEIRFAPELHKKRGLTSKEIIAAVVAGIRDAEAQYEIKGNVILSYMRFSSEEGLMHLLDEALPFLRNGVVAADLCAGEHQGFSRNFTKAMAYAKFLGYDITVHAGETGFVENIVEAIVLLGATRIGHGVAMFDHEQAKKLVRDKKVFVECCPTSNLQTKAVAGYDAHPMHHYLTEGIGVTMNTDNRTVSNTTMTAEFSAMSECFGWNVETERQIYLHSVDASFADEETKAWLRAFVA